MASPKTQAKQRRPVMAADQFGRPWSFSIEIITGDPTGLISPAGWADPMRTPQKYLKVPRNQFGLPDYSRISVKEQQWITDQEYHVGEYETRFLETASDKMPGGFDINTVFQNPWLKRLAGPRPFPSPRCLRAAFDVKHPASRALLGLEPLNEAAMELLGINVAVARRREEEGSRALGDSADTTATPLPEEPQKEELPIPDMSDLPDGMSYNQFVSWARKVMRADMKTTAKWWKVYKEERAP